MVFYDNACTLKKFAQNRKRSERNETTRAVGGLHYMLDIWHVHNHTKCLQDPVEGPVLDPRSPQNDALRRAVNTEACEQAFSFIDRVTYVGLNMGPGMFHAFTYLLMDRENEKLIRRRA